MYRSHVLVCGGTGCTSSGSPKIMEALKYEIKRQGLEEEVAVVETGCHGLCALGPIMIVYPDATFYSMVQVNDISEIVSEHLLKGRVVTRLLYQETVSPTGGIKALIDTDFYKKQHRIALRNCGVINPENIEEYIGTGGYQALGKVLTEMTPDDVIQTLLDAGLRGRGGAGFPTGLKWKLCKQNDADQKYVCCNADEGDPGAFMDRSVLEGDPHVVLEAMACGIPVVLRDIPVYEGWLHHGVEVYKAIDQDGFRTQVEGLLNGTLPPLQEAELELARGRSLEQMGRRLRAVYEREGLPYQEEMPSVMAVLHKHIPLYFR